MKSRCKLAGTTESRKTTKGKTTFTNCWKILTKKIEDPCQSEQEEEEQEQEEQEEQEDQEHSSEEEEQEEEEEGEKEEEY